MKYYLICFSVFFILFLHTPANYDYLMLSETWPPTFCKSNPCTIVPIPTNFTVHGLWPNKKKGRNPEFCDSTSKFDYKNVSKLPHIESHWPDLKGDNLWEHEWMKHGTCSQLPVLDYFKLTLELYSRNDVKEILNRNRIYTDTQQCYEPSHIVTAISNEIDQKRPQLTCDSGYLAEVRICFDKTADHKYVNCKTSNSCNSQVCFP